ncbi:hypothetical protein [Microbacterium sp. 3J1]|uniref:hypothetical protein n=1 Tax=Microbacterium sp. 3J1 TaxID=861269 RepID=UPI000A61ABF0|nr:hypothetical protein [Microbacterium sp. 3J1]
MTRRAWWLTAGGAALVLVVLAGLWFWEASSDRAETQPPATPTAAPTRSIDVRALAQVELDEHLEQCAAEGMPGGEASPGCGIRLPWGTEFAAVDDAALRIEQLPRLELEGDSDGEGDYEGFVADGGILVATVTGTGHDGAPRTETYRTESWSVRGDVVVSDGAVRLEVW